MKNFIKVQIVYYVIITIIFLVLNKLGLFRVDIIWLLMGFGLVSNFIWLEFNIDIPIEKLVKLVNSIDLEEDNTEKIEAIKNINLIKMLNLDTLVDKLKDMIQMLIEQQKVVTSLEYLSEHDNLTGCYNRLKLDKRTSYYNKLREYGVIFFDLNNLKKMNDIYGHDDGDILLKNAAKQLSFWITYGDLYRIGGDEFLVVVPNIIESKLTPMIEYWYKGLDILNKDYKANFDCKFSYGVSYKTIDEDKTFEDIMVNADTLMYDMKVTLKGKEGIKK